jgi:HB1, ASXL, restriction endonuclease HTH domain
MSKSKKSKPAAVKSEKAKKEKKVTPKRVSALDAAAQLLADAKAPMNCVDLITQMAEKNLWKSPGGKTPSATLHAAIAREIKVGKESRFRKADRGQFEIAGA